MGVTFIEATASLQCPHGGRVTFVPSQTRVRASGVPLVLQNDQALVAGCAFTVPPPQPCLRVQFMTASVRVRVSGQPVLLQTSTGLCMAAAPQGTALVVSTQTRVRGV